MVGRTVLQALGEADWSHRCRRRARTSPFPTRRRGHTMSTTFETIRYEVADGIARLTLNRPEKLNAISNTMLHEIHDALWEADDDKSVHCVVLAGEGR